MNVIYLDFSKSFGMISPNKVKSQLSSQTQWAMVNGLYSTQRSSRDYKGLYCDQSCSTTISIPGGSSGSAQSVIRFTEDRIGESAQCSQGQCCHPVGPRQARGLG